MTKKRVKKTLIVETTALEKIRRNMRE